MQKGICIITEQEVSGIPIKEDAVISTIRKIKRLFGIAKNNALVVGADSMEEYKKRRAKFERTFVQYVALAIIMVAAFVLLPLFFGAPFSLGSLAMSVLIGVFIILLSFSSYIPSLDAPSENKASPAQAPVAPAQKGSQSQKAARKNPAQKKSRTVK